VPKAESLHKVDYNQQDMLEYKQKLFSRECGLIPGLNIIVGVSGGPDSLCVLDLLHRFDYPVIVACLDHGIRKEAAAEVSMVLQFAERMGLPFVANTVDTPAFSALHGMSIEAAARQLRYDFLFEQAEKHHAQAIVVGHTADDQAETIFMHLLRGAGLNGLKGMEFRSFLHVWSKTIPLVRPLLTTWRSEVMEYCVEYGLTPVSDSTNQSSEFFRNRLRLEVLPYLEQIQPNFRRHLVRMARALSLDYALVMSQVECAWESCLVRQGIGWIAFNREVFLQHPVGIQHHLLRKAMALHRPGLPDIDFAVVERARVCLERENSRGTCDLAAGLRLELEHNTIWVVTWEADIPTGNWPAILMKEAVELPVPGKVILGDGWELRAELCQDLTSIQPSALTGMDPYQTWLDGARTALPLTIRARLPGDRIQPLGMPEKTVKLSDLMINLKLPQRARATWPLVCARDEIVWVAGCRSSHSTRVGVETRQAIHLILTHNSGLGSA